MSGDFVDFFLQKIKISSLIKGNIEVIFELFGKISSDK